jgi:hypothetical protein
MLTDATIVPFRHPNRFGRPELAELVRWSKSATHALWFLQEDVDHLTRDSQWIAQTDDGDEYVSVAHGSPGAALDFMVAPLSGRWQLFDYRGQLIGTFRSLRDALEAIYPTFPGSVDLRKKSRFVAA